MAGLSIVGRAPSNAKDIATRIAQAQTVAAASPSQVSAQTEINSQVALKAAKAYIDTQASLYVSPSYYHTKDLLNLPTASVGAPNQVNGTVTALPASSYYGAAALDSSTKIPVAQVSPVGAGYVLGPFGPTAGFQGSTTTTPFKVADWNIGVQSVVFVPWVFVDLLVASTMGKPVVDICISNGQAVYSAQTLVARGIGRTCFSDPQVLAAHSYPAAPGETGPAALKMAANTNIWLSAWIYDALGQTVSVAQDSIINGAVYLVRVQQ